MRQASTPPVRQNGGCERHLLLVRTTRRSYKAPAACAHRHRIAPTGQRPASAPASLCGVTAASTPIATPRTLGRSRRSSRGATTPVPTRTQDPPTRHSAAPLLATSRAGSTDLMPPVRIVGWGRVGHEWDPRERSRSPAAPSANRPQLRGPFEVVLSRCERTAERARADGTPFPFSFPPTRIPLFHGRF